MNAVVRALDDAARFVQTGSEAVTLSLDAIEKSLLPRIIREQAAEIARAAKPEQVHGYIDTVHPARFIQHIADDIARINPEVFARVTSDLGASPGQVAEGVLSLGRHPSAVEMASANQAVIGWTQSFVGRMRAEPYLGPQLPDGLAPLIRERVAELGPSANLQL